MSKKIPYRIKEPFNCMVFDKEPVEVTNPYSKESIVLTPEEVAVYDSIKGAELFGVNETIRKGIDWFIENNIKAYKVLLD